MLSGRRPFDGTNLDELIDEIKHHDPKPLRQIDADIPRELERICFRALCKRASDRYLTGQDLAEDLRAFLQTTAGATSSYGFARGLDELDRVLRQRH